jgi:hypothetical protein
MRISNNVLIFIFFAFFAIAVTAPWACSDYVGPGDLKVYISNISEAKLALMQHQFPVRVSPSMVDGMGYPFLQFYSPFLFSLEGLLNFIIENPFQVGKMIIWIALTLGGFYMYRLCNWFTGSPAASLLAAVCYITAPYLIVVFNVIGHFAETVALGLLPIVLYYSFQLFTAYEIRHFILTAMLWAILAMTHMITCAYSLLFSLLLFLLLIFPKQSKFKWKNLILVLFSITFAFCLAGWFLFPAMIYKHRFAVDLLSPYSYPWRLLTPFAGLISLKSISPIPLPSNGILVNEFFPAVGLPILLGFAICFYAYLKDITFHKKSMLPFLIVFLLAFFATWTPFDFWQYIPKYFVILQFSYRLLAQVMWIGCILLAYAFVWIAKDKLDHKFFIIMLCLIAINNTSWMHSAKAESTDKVALLKKYVVNLYQRDYAIPPAKLHRNEALPTRRPIDTCTQQQKYKICTASVTKKETIIALPQLYYPNMLRIQVNGQDVNYYPMVYKNNTVITGIKLMPGHYEISALFTGLRWANWISAGTWFLAFFILFANLSWNYQKKHASYTVVCDQA